MNKLVSYSSFADLKKAEVNNKPIISTQKELPQRVEQFKMFIDLLRNSISNRHNSKETQTFESNGQ